jgi:hypothetical protein
VFNWLRWLLRRPRKKKESAAISQKESPPKKERKVKLYPARNLVLLTSETNMRLVPCKVNDDHTLVYGKKKRMIKPDRPAHVFEIPIGKIWPTRLGRLLGPRSQKYNVYTIQETGEMTHDPHLDQMDEEMKLKFEKLLGLMGKFAEVQAGAVMYEGIKGKKAWWDYIPYLVMLGIVFLFLFAMSQGVSG